MHFQFPDLPYFFPATLKFLLAFQKYEILSYTTPTLLAVICYWFCKPYLQSYICYWFCNFHCHISCQYLSIWPKQTPFHYILRANNASVVFLVKIRENNKKKLEKNKNLKATYLPYFFILDVTGNMYFFFGLKTYVVGAHWNRLGKAFLMNTHNIGFHEDLTKIIFQLSSNFIKYAIYLFFWIQS